MLVYLNVLYEQLYIKTTTGLYILVSGLYILVSIIVSISNTH